MTIAFLSNMDHSADSSLASMQETCLHESGSGLQYCSFSSQAHSLQLQLGAHPPVADDDLEDVKVPATELERAQVYHVNLGLKKFIMQ